VFSELTLKLAAAWPRHHLWRGCVQPASDMCRHCRSRARSCRPVTLAVKQGVPALRVLASADGPSSSPVQPNN